MSWSVDLIIVRVAVAVIVQVDRSILVSQRRAHSDHGGLWEFPGGKVESHESVYEALCRELKEEVNLDVLSASPFIQVSHSYEKYDVLLDTWLVEQFNGEPQGVEGQLVRWVCKDELRDLPMPEANDAIKKALFSQ